MTTRPPQTRAAPDIPPDIGDDEPKTDPALRVVRDAVRKKLQPEMHSELNWQGAKLTVAMVVVAIGTAFGAYTFVVNEARAQTDAGIKGHETRLTAVEQEVPELRKEVYETRSELRELYKAVVDHKRSETLEQPVPKLSAPDAGTQK